MNETLPLLKRLELFRVGQSVLDSVVSSALAENKLLLRCLIIHSQSHTRWAKRLSVELTQTFPHIIKGVRLACDEKVIGGTYADVEEQLGEVLDLKRTGEEHVYAFMVTTGRWESEIVQQIRELAGITIPQLYCITDVPTSQSLPLTTRRSDAPLSGVFSRPTDPQKFLDAVLALKRDARRVCFLIDDREDLADDDFSYDAHHQRIDTHFRSAGVEVVRHYWTVSQPRLTALEQRALDADVFFLFNDPSAHAHIRAVHEVCKSYKVLLCSSELDSVLDGAAIGAGVTGASFAQPLLRLITEFLWSRDVYSNPHPILIPEQPCLHYNYHAMVEQGVELSPEEEALLRMKSMFDRYSAEF